VIISRHGALLTCSHDAGKSVIVAAMSNLSPSGRREMPLLVTAAIIFDGEKVLVTRRPHNKRHPGLWEFPGGKIDPGESPEQALTREIREELDVEIGVEGIFEAAYYRYEWGPVLILAYTCRLLAGSLRNLGVAERRWVHPRDLSALPFLPADQPILARLVDRRVP
jgi:8-oxo-dGTP diphosphatase